MTRRHTPTVPRADAASPAASPWRRALAEALITFLVGNALGFMVAGFYAPLDMNLVREMPDYSSMMDRWVRWGVPAVTLLAVLRLTLRARSRHEPERWRTLVLSVAPFLLASGLIVALYPGSRAAQVRVDDTRRLALDAREMAVSLGIGGIDRIVARLQGTPHLDEALRLATQGPVRRAPLAPQAHAALRQVFDEGRPADCPACRVTMRAQLIWDEIEPGLVDWAFRECEDRDCRDRLLDALIGPATPPAYRLCEPLPPRYAPTVGDLYALRRMAASDEAFMAASGTRRLRDWLAWYAEHCGERSSP